jgi:hypothetical protein
VEAIFALPYLGYAAESDLSAFGADVFTAAAGAAAPDELLPRQ